jgi:polysaccharide export outer membrane protein
MTQSFFRRSVALCLLFLTGCVSTAPPLYEPDAAVPEQAIRPGDRIKVVVWREPDLSGEFMVDPSWHVVLPRVGKWDVRNETESSLEDKVTAALREELRNPSVDLQVLRRIRILGSVDRPGLYPVDNTMTVSDALAQAGGASMQGKKDVVELVRGGERFTIKLQDDHKLSELPLRSGDVLYVPERNWFLRNYGVVLTVLTSAAGVAAVIITSSGSN